jgi:hypothetical protein
MTAHSLLGREMISNGAWNLSFIFHHFGRFGLEMHIGRGASLSKTKCVFFPPPPILPACATPQRRREIDPMCLLPYIYQHHPTPTHRTTYTKLNLSYGLPYWLPCCGRIIPPRACMQRRNSMQIDHEIRHDQSRRHTHQNHPHTPKVTCRLPPRWTTKNKLRR